MILWPVHLFSFSTILLQFFPSFMGFLLKQWHIALERYFIQFLCVCSILTSVFVIRQRFDLFVYFQLSQHFNFPFYYLSPDCGSLSSTFPPFLATALPFPYQLLRGGGSFWGLRLLIDVSFSIIYCCILRFHFNPLMASLRLRSSLEIKNYDIFENFYGLRPAFLNHGTTERACHRHPPLSHPTDYSHPHHHLFDLWHLWGNTGSTRRFYDSDRERELISQ